ncbi:MAG: glucose 1-dehydrogenase [Deltaproteobacteria bacterium]|nr:glucose 1-dehydrogenase [Deltaproteobacteria bacterium]
MDDLFSGDVLKGKLSIVTGGGRGLGRFMALALARAGSDVVLTARSDKEIGLVAQEISGLGRNALPLRADITKVEDVALMVERVKSEFRAVDILVNNAGQNASYAHQRFEDIPDTEWREMIETNVNGVFLVTKFVGAIMLQQGKGSVVNIASSFGVKAIPTRICYSVSKAAVIQMTRSLAVEWASRGVRVNCIAPGSFDLFPDSRDEAYLGMNEERKRRVPMGRLGRPEELGPLLVYLASDASDYVTGEVVFIDGGLAAT